jgi:lysine-specific demethylase 8
MTDAMRITDIARCSALDVETFERAFCGRAPVIISGAMQGWPACGLWSQSWFAEHYGKLDVAVQTWTNARMGAEQMTLGRLVEAIRDGNGTYHCLARQPVFDSAPELRSHFVAPAFVRAERLDTYLFLGPQGLVTPIHFELSDGLLCQIAGRKRALLFAPELRTRLGYPPLYRRKFFFGAFDPENPDPALAADASLSAFAGEVGPGEILYVPSRWHHHVRSLEASISVNFLWKRPVARVLSAVLTRLGRNYD